jgi:type III secretion protein C
MFVAAGYYLYMKSILIKFLTIAALVQPLLLSSEEGYTINFEDVSISEFIRFVSRVSEVNFIFDNKDLQFNVTISTGKPLSSENVVKALIQMLRLQGFEVSEEGDYYVIHRMEEGSALSGGDGKDNIAFDKLAVSSRSSYLNKEQAPLEFGLYKLQYHQGSEIEEAIRGIAGDIKSQPNSPKKLLNAIHTLQWIKGTNSLMYSGDKETLAHLRKLIESLDTPKKQVFIEVLVIETDARSSLEFGLQWAAGGEFGGRVGVGTGNFPERGGSGFASSMQGINATNRPTGLGQIPIGVGFDLGVIGDIIMHKGRSYLSLGALVSALQADGDSTIVLNHKIIAQDNKNSKIFVGDNIPFTGSVVETVGHGQQTTANIEYRDVGVSLSITPMLGDGGVITLDIDEEISQALPDLSNSNQAVGGIRTTKTNMVTHANVPDQHFLVLSGMIRNTKRNHKAGLPCLGALPWIGALFSKTLEHEEKRNVIIFVRPTIIRNFEESDQLTRNQEEFFRSQALPADFDSALKFKSDLEGK